MNAPSPLAGFDAAADRYDADEAGNRVLAHMRARAFRQLSASFCARRAPHRAGVGDGHRGGSPGRPRVPRGARGRLSAAARSRRGAGSRGAGRRPAGSSSRPRALGGRPGRRLRARARSTARTRASGRSTASPASTRSPRGSPTCVRPGRRARALDHQPLVPGRDRLVRAHGRWREARAPLGRPVVGRRLPRRTERCPHLVLLATRDRARVLARLSWWSTPRRCRCSGRRRTSISSSPGSSRSFRRSSRSSGGRRRAPCCATSAITCFCACAGGEPRRRPLPRSSWVAVAQRAGAAAPTR